MLPPLLCTREEFVNSLQFLGYQSCRGQAEKEVSHSRTSQKRVGDSLFKLSPTGTQGGLWDVLAGSKLSSVFLILFLVDCTPFHIPALQLYLLIWMEFQTSVGLRFTWWESFRYASCVTGYSSSKAGLSRLGCLLHGYYYFVMSRFWHVSIISKHCMASSSNSWG